MSGNLVPCLRENADLRPLSSRSLSPEGNECLSKIDLQVRLMSACSSRSSRAEVGGDDDGCVSERIPPRVKMSDIYKAMTTQSSPAGEMKAASSLRLKPEESIQRMMVRQNLQDRHVCSDSDLILRKSVVK